MVLSITSILGNLTPDLVILFEIGVLIIIATLLAFLIKKLKQPIIPAYIIAGIIIGPLVLGLVKNQDLINSLSEIGVAFLIFTAGLEINFKKLKEVGSTIAISGILQVVITFAITFGICLLFGLQNQAAIYVGLIVAFSSTMIVVKILADKRELNSLHGRIIIGILLMQDIIAIIALMVLSSNFTILSLAIVLAKGVILGVLAFLLAKAINPIIRASADSQELLLLVSISFLFLFVIGVSIGGFSLVIGAFFAGVALANSDYKTEIEGKITPLREFFAVIFFVSLGMQLNFIDLKSIYLLIALFFMIIIIKPLIVMFLIRISGYKKSTSFFCGNSLGQTSEFSLILATLALGIGQIDKNLFSTLVLLTILTMTLTVYFIKYEKKFLKIFSFPLNILNKIKSKNEQLEYHDRNGNKIIIIGCHRMGSLFLKEFEKNKKDIFVVDYNPEIIKSLINKKIPCIYGDFANEEVFEKSEVKGAEIIISTIPDVEDNLILVKKIRKVNREAMIFVVADRISEALKLYNSGVDYVVLPQVVSGQRVSSIIENLSKNKSDISRLKKEHIKYLHSIHNILY